MAPLQAIAIKESIRRPGVISAVLHKTPHAVIARSGATRQSRFFRQLQIARLRSLSRVFKTRLLRRWLAMTNEGPLAKTAFSTFYEIDQHWALELPGVAGITAS